MARIRTIKPEFFRHADLFEAEKETGFPLRLAFAGLWTAADREGRFKWKPRELKLDCLPHDDVDFSRVLDALATRGWIVRYAVDGVEYGAIPTWKAHQIINNREKASDIPAPNEINILTREARVDDASGTRLEGKGREGKGKGREGVNRSDADASRPRDEKFEEFWKVYPRREGANPKEPARKQFNSAVKAGADPDEIIAGAKRCRVVEAKNIGTPYIPQAVKWLRDERWNDYPARPEGDDGDGLIEVLEQRALEAWDAYGLKMNGRAYPRNKKGGWRFPTKWPPGQAEEQLRGVQALLASQGASQ